MADRCETIKNNKKIAVLYIKLTNLSFLTRFKKVDNMSMRIPSMYVEELHILTPQIATIIVRNRDTHHNSWYFSLQFAKSHKLQQTQTAM